MRKILSYFFIALGGLPIGILARDTPPRETYPIMQPDWDTRQRWMASSLNAPRAQIDNRLLFTRKASANLLSHLEYTPSERNQESCGNCWSWAGTGVMEISLDVQNGIKDRLSVQFLCTCGGFLSCGCQGGWLEDVVNFYQSTPYAVPWSNPGASFLNGDGTCNNSCYNIGASPNYPISSISLVTIETQSVSSNTAISNIKNLLDQNKAVWFGFFLPRETDWNTFYSFWDYQDETAVFDPVNAYGRNWDSGGGGHAVLVVGYNTDDPDENNHYWLILNSWGTASGGRPNGLMRWKMHMNYKAVAYDRGQAEYLFYWQTLNMTYTSTNEKPVVATSNATDIAASSAIARGSVNPKGLATAYWFQYGPTTGYGSSTTPRSAGAGTTVSNVHEMLSGLSESQTYHVRLVASNSAGVGYGVDRSFTTTGGSPVAPDVVTEPADSIGPTSAVLNASVNPRGYETAFAFQYGLTEAYGSTTPTQFPGSATTSLTVQAAISGLSTSTVYHFRAVAWNSGGTNYGADRTFSTVGPAAVLLSEGFEHGGSIPSGWTWLYISRNWNWMYIDWTYENGGYWNKPPAAHSGSYNAYFFDMNYGAATALITPPIDFGTGYAEATLTFWLYMAVDFWWGDQDELWMYIAPSLNGPWTLLTNYTHNISTWTLETIHLPNPTGTCYLAFDGISYWANGVAVDDVEVCVKSTPDPGPSIANLNAQINGYLLFGWDAEAGQLFKVDYSADLLSGSWQEDTEAGTLIPSDNRVSYSNSLAAVTNRYYRVRRISP